MKLCDLHVHSVYSDGTETPREILEAAVKLGLSAVALCDHNTADGLPEFLHAAKSLPVEAIAGAEFSVDCEGRELHLLGLFLPEEAFPRISARMDAFIERKKQSNRDLIASLNAAGYRVDFERLRTSTPNGKFNRAHVAAELVRLGYVSDTKRAFDTLLSKHGGHYKEPERPDLFEMIGFLRSVGAVPVLAHPFLNRTKDELETLLPAAKEAGLVGMECLYSEYDAETTAESFALAKRFGLLPSGGSDYHGKNKPDVSLGIGKGDLKIPYEWAEQLKSEV